LQSPFLTANQGAIGGMDATLSQKREQMRKEDVSFIRWGSTMANVKKRGGKREENISHKLLSLLITG
jgi:hypothetical protein